MVVMPDIRTALKTEKPDPNAIHHKSLKFAHSFDVDLTPENSGEWTRLSDGSQVWRLSVSSEGAFSINLIFTKYHLPKGAKLFIYTPDMKQVLGSFTSENNKQSGVLPTMPLQGDRVIVEYIEPANVPFSGKLKVGKVNHAFLDVNTQLKSASALGDFKSSEDCEVDITCESGWETEQRGVVKMIIDGTELCTGTLVNNTNQDGKPYVLTAAHCFKSYDFNGAGTIFIFNYEVPNCYTNIEGSREQSVAGGIMRAYSEQDSYLNTDYALVEMSVPPPEAYRPYYCGWDASLTNERDVVTIHQPNGDVKKISFDSDPIALNTLSIRITTDSVYYYKSLAHWQVIRWDSGVTEGGSSGCALFNQEHLVIGGLSAGQASCGNPVNDFYYNLNKAWTSHTNPSKTLKYWLDPIGSNVTKLGGFYPSDYKNIQRLTNIEKNESLSVIKLGSKGYQSGFNKMDVTRFAEHFKLTDTCRLYGFYFVPYSGSSSSAVSMVFKVWKGGAAPGEEIWSKKVYIKEWIRRQVVASNYGKTGGYYLKNLYGSKENFLEIPEEVYPGDDFFVGFEIVPSGPVDSLALYQAADRGDSGKNTAWFYRNGNWDMYPLYADAPTNTSLFIDAVVKIYDKSNDTPTTTTSNKIVRYIESYSHNTNQMAIYFNETLEHSATIDVFTLNGKLLYKTVIPAGVNTFDIDFNGNSRGVYLLRFKYKNGLEVHKVLR